MRRAFRIWLNSVGFLSLVLATLIFCAALFAFKLDIDEHLSNERYPTGKHHAEHEIPGEEGKVFGVGAEGWTALFTGGLFVFTMLLAAFTYRLFQVTKQGISDQAESTREALRHASVSADAAQESAAAVTAAERCYLRVMDLDCLPGNAFHIDTDTRYGVAILTRFFLRNFGKTPADIVSVAAHIGIGNILYPGSDDAEPCSPRDVLRGEVIAASADSDIVSIGERIYIDRSQSNDLTREAIYIWLELIIVYFDVFGKRQVAHDWWCYQKDRRGVRRFTRRIEDDD